MKKIQLLLLTTLLTTSTLIASTQVDSLIVVDHDSLFRSYKKVLVSGSHPHTTLNDINSAIEVMPNPIKNSLFIKIDDGLMGEMEIRLIDWHGHIFKVIKLDKTTAIEQQIIKMTDVPKGAYTLEIKQNTAYAYKKIIKK